MTVADDRGCVMCNVLCASASRVYSSRNVTIRTVINDHAKVRATAYAGETRFWVRACETLDRENESTVGEP